MAVRERDFCLSMTGSVGGKSGIITQESLDQVDSSEANAMTKLKEKSPFKN